MKLESSILIGRSPDDVWNYLSDASNVAKWDRGVYAVKPLSPGPPGVGYEFETFADAHGGGRMAYRIMEADPETGCVVQLTSKTGNARYFQSANWCFRVKADAAGTLLTCSVEFILHLRYIFLGPVFSFLKNAIHTDLTFLKRRLEE